MDLNIRELKFLRNYVTNSCKQIPKDHGDYSLLKTLREKLFTQEKLLMLQINTPIKISSDNYEYQTKCRICGKLHDWHFSKKSNIELKLFHEAMIDYIKTPRSYHCDDCKKHTIQELVSYSWV